MAAAAVIVGSANFTENQILGELYAQAMKAKGVDASTKLNIGSREVYIKALAGRVDLRDPGVHGQPAALLRQEGDRDHDGRRSRRALPKAIGADLKILSRLEAADQDVYVVTKQISEQNQHDLAGGPEEGLGQLDPRRTVGAGEPRVRTARAGEDLRRDVQAVQAVRLAGGQGART